MKTLLTLFVLFFSPSVFAENISDFQIEGISIGDSLLDYYSEEDINKNLHNYFANDHTYAGVEFYKLESFKIYHGLVIDFKRQDKNFVIESISGTIFSISIFCSSEF